MPPRCAPTSTLTSIAPSGVQVIVMDLARPPLIFARDTRFAPPRTEGGRSVGVENHLVSRSVCFHSFFHTPTLTHLIRTHAMPKLCALPLFRRRTALASVGFGSKADPGSTRLQAWWRCSKYVYEPVDIAETHISPVPHPGTLPLNR